ncbi:potassium translocating ATPase, subunit C [Candidatus Desulfosporosinus infrequens]|uniref:Potassium-transporting ATPase KdpC subunit n=1 Tax=Candidatus Desulfosporosinus infrequens TaxID=2043169 RepID=A0A2U3LTT4_9FIRM|nr:potassium translocating ATPase, subunit C [Candidatus Desulfosporosinus infrequens]
MWKQTIGVLRLLIVLTVLTGLIYPLAMTGVAQTIFPAQANGSLAYVDNKPVGSLLIGQNFSDAKYFHGRPSAAGTDGYDATSSSGSNLGPTSKKLMDGVKENLDKVRTENQLGEQAVVPSDLVLASGSGLDPDISPDGAYLQVERVASERHVASSAVKALVDSHVQTRTVGLLGESRVNVLALNMALDKMGSK